MDRWKIWTEFNQFVRCRSKPCSRKSIATCYWNDPIHPGGFFIPGPSAFAEVCTTVHGYGNPISDTGQKRLRMSRVVKIYRLIDVPGHTVPPSSPAFPPSRTMILDFMRRLTRRENFQPFFSSPSFFFLFSPFFSRDPSTFHPSRERGRCSIVGKSEEVFSRLMGITDKQRNPYRNIYIVKFLFRGYNFSSPLGMDIVGRRSIVQCILSNICYLRFTMLIEFTRRHVHVYHYRSITFR